MSYLINVVIWITINASAAWSSVTITDFNKPECMQTKSAALRHNRFVQHMEYNYDNL
jgi:hypothetical protein